MLDNKLAYFKDKMKEWTPGFIIYSLIFAMLWTVSSLIIYYSLSTVKIYGVTEWSKPIKWKQGGYFYYLYPDKDKNVVVLEQVDATSGDWRTKTVYKLSRNWLMLKCGPEFSDDKKQVLFVRVLEGRVEILLEKLDWTVDSPGVLRKVFSFPFYRKRLHMWHIAERIPGKDKRIFQVESLPPFN